MRVGTRVARHVTVEIDQFTAAVAAATDVRGPNVAVHPHYCYGHTIIITTTTVAAAVAAASWQQLQP